MGRGRDENRTQTTTRTTSTYQSDHSETVDRPPLAKDERHCFRLNPTQKCLVEASNHTQTDTGYMGCAGALYDTYITYMVTITSMNSDYSDSATKQNNNRGLRFSLRVKHGMQGQRTAQETRDRHALKQRPSLVAFCPCARLDCVQGHLPLRKATICY